MKTGEVGINSRTKERLVTDPDALLKGAKIFSELSGVLKEAAGSDESFAQICREHGFDWQVVRTLLKSKMVNNCKVENSVDLAHAVHEGENEYDNFYKAIFPEEYSQEVKLPFDYVVSVEAVLNQLSERDKKIIYLRFGFEENMPQTFNQIGKEFGISREYARQILVKIIRKLRKPPLSDILSYGLYEYNILCKTQELEKQAAFKQAEENAIQKISSYKKYLCENGRQKDIPVERLGLSIRALNRLKRNNICTLEELMILSDQEIRNFYGVGEVVFKEIKSKKEEFFFPKYNQE